MARAHSWLSEGFDVPAEIIAAGIEDLSWHNDVCPSFGATIGDSGVEVRIFVEHPDRLRRERPDVERFAVAILVSDAEEAAVDALADAGVITGGDSPVTCWTGNVREALDAYDTATAAIAVAFARAGR